MSRSNISLQRHETLRSGLLRVVDLLIDSIADSLTHLSLNEQGIHRVRTTIKRLRALLRLIRPGIDPAFFNCEDTRLRTAAGLLSFARDAEVARGTLEMLPVSEKTEQEAVATALAGFDSRVELPKDLDQIMAEVRRRVEQTRRNFCRLELRGTEREIVESGVRAVYRQSRNRMKVAIAQSQDNAFHRWRIRAKNLYYELEFLESVWPKRFHRMVSLLSKFQDQIGLDHDVAVLRSWLEKTPEQFGGTETVGRIVTCLDSETRKLRRVVVPLGRKIWREKARRFARQVVQHWSKR